MTTSASRANARAKSRVARAGADSLSDGRLVVATWNSGHFDFMAVAHSANAAKAALLDGWMEHCNQYQDADRDLCREAILGGEVNFTFLYPGQCARDLEVISA